MWLKFALGINKPGKFSTLKEVLAGFTNRYGGPCALPECGRQVGAQEGLCEKNPNGPGFLCFHKDCYQKWQAGRGELQRKGVETGSASSPISAARKELKLSATSPNMAMILFPYNFDIVMAIKICFDGASFRKEFEGYANVWLLPFSQTNATHVVKTLKGLGFAIDPKAEAVVTEHGEAYQNALKKGMLEFQAEDIEWLSQQSRALLAHDMGLGKTAISLLSLPKNRGAIVVCPLAIVESAWVAEIKHWVPEFQPIVIKSKKDFRFPQAGEIVIVSYERLPDEFIPPWTTLEIKGEKVKYRDFNALDEELQRAFSRYSVIVDEAHYVKKLKNRRSVKVRSLCKYAASSWMLTGTPLANRPQDLYGLLVVGDMIKQTFRPTKLSKDAETINSYDLFNKLMGAIWGDVTPKAKKVQPKTDEEEDEKEAPPDRRGRIRIITGWGTPSPLVPGILGKVMIRRKKSDTLTLPPKEYSNVLVDIDDPALMEEMNVALQEWIAKAQDDNQEITEDEYGESPGDLPPFEEFSKIRADLAAYKIDAALKIVEDFESRNQPLIVFSAHVAPVNIIGDRDGWAKIHGGIKTEERSQVVADFQNGKLKGLALTIGAGGVGYTLTRAASVLFVDMAWTPGDNAQAEDRINRIGQKADRLNIIRLLVNHPIDIHIVKLLDMKQKWIDASIDGRVQEILAQGDESGEEPEIFVNGEMKKIEDCTEEEIRAAVYQQLGSESTTAVRPQQSVDRVEKPKPGHDVPLTMSRKSAIWRALEYLLSQCDGARNLDSCGFNKLDADMIRVFMQRVEDRQQQSGNWNPIQNATDNEFRWLQSTLAKYRNTQLGREHATIWEEPTAEIVPPENEEENE